MHVTDPLIDERSVHDTDPVLPERLPPADVEIIPRGKQTNLPV